MEQKVLPSFKKNLKPYNIVENIRIHNREDAERTKESRKQRYLFYKRTNVQLDFDIEEAEILSLDDVKKLSLELSNKSGNAEDCLKRLIKAFRIDPSYVNTFLEEEKSLFSLVGFLTGSNSKLQLYATYCITNITSVNHRYQAAVAKSCASYLITYLSSEVPLKQDLCATSLGNIASEGEEYREILKAQGIIKPLINLFKADSGAVLEAASFAAIQLCTGSDDTADQLMSLGIGQLLVLNLKLCKSESAVGQMAWLLFCLASNEKRLMHLLELGMLNMTMKYFPNTPSCITRNITSATAFLRLLGNATVCCNPAIAETLKESSVLSLLKPFIGCDVAHIVKEALWVTSNIIAIDEYFALQAVKEGILESLERSLNYGESIQKEVMICVCTLSTYGLTILENIIKKSKFLEHSLQLMQCKYSALSTLAMQFIEMVLRLYRECLDHAVEISIHTSLCKLSNSEDHWMRISAAELCLMYYSDTELK